MCQKRALAIRAFLRAVASPRGEQAGARACVAAATHPVLATVAGSRWWPRAAAALARLARGEGHGDDALRDVAADALRLVLSVGPVRAAAPLAAADRDQVCGAGADLACARDRRCLACCRPATLACACRRVVFCRRGRGDCQRRVWRQHRAGCRAAAPAPVAARPAPVPPPPPRRDPSAAASRSARLATKFARLCIPLARTRGTDGFRLR